MFQSPHFYQVRIRGLQGNQGEKGEKGDPGSPGVGLPAAGFTGQVLRKASGVDYDTEWFTLGALASGYDAGDVPVTPAGNISSTDVQSALQELDTEKAAAGHNHDGSYQPLDADLTALAALASTGVLVRSAADTYSLRSVAGTANQISVFNGDGVAGNPTISAVVASQAQAEAGTDNTSLMTALRTAQAIAALAAGSGLSFALFQNQQASGTNIAAVTSGAWRTATLNTEVYDPDGIASLSGNQITVIPGTYLIIGEHTTQGLSGPGGSYWRARLYDVGAAATIAQGAQGGMYSSAIGAPVSAMAAFVAASSKTIELQVRVSSSTGGGAGAISSGDPEVYASVLVIKAA